MSKRRLAWLGIGAVLLVGMLATTVTVYNRVGRTPGEIIAHLQKRLEGHPTLQALSTPVLGGLRVLLGEPDLGGPQAPFVVPRLPPNPMSVEQGRANTSPGVIRVGPGRALSSLSRAAEVARDGDVIEVDPGDYVADVAVWDRAELTIRGVGSRVRLIAAGASAEDKAIWVVRRGKVTVEGIDFIGARVAERNGAGIRFEAGELTVRRCLFHDNENGIVTTGNPEAQLVVENSEFGYNGAGDGYSHGIYAGRIALLRVTGSYFHHANIGHLVKSRARRSEILYNRITDETGGRASYELEFPNGGLATVIGNVVQQGRETRNSVIVSYGAEGYAWPRNEFALAHNTIVNDHPLGGTFVHVAPGAGLALSRNNLYVGRGLVERGIDAAGDARVAPADLAAGAGGPFGLGGSADARRAAAAAVPTAPELTPQFEYEHPLRLRRLPPGTRVPGALQPAAAATGPAP